MAVQFSHTLVACRDKRRSATFLATLLGLPPPRPFAPFLVVELSNGVSLDFSETAGEVAVQHDAFLVSEGEFDSIFGRLRQRGRDYWADPGQRRVGEINRRDGGRGVYFEDPGGHLLERLIRPDGSGK